MTDSPAVPPADVATAPAASATAARAGWHKDPRHWYCIAGAIAATVAGIILIELNVEGRRLGSLIESETAAVQRTKARKEQLTADKLGFQTLLEANLDQKEKVVREIANFQEELNVLTRKTERLEQVRDDLKRLETAYAQYRRVEDEFNKSLALLNAAVKKGQR